MAKVCTLDNAHHQLALIAVNTTLVHPDWLMTQPNNLRASTLHTTPQRHIPTCSIGSFMPGIHITPVVVAASLTPLPSRSAATSLHMCWQCSSCAAHDPGYPGLLSAHTRTDAASQAYGLTDGPHAQCTSLPHCEHGLCKHQCNWMDMHKIYLHTASSHGGSLQ